MSICVIESTVLVRVRRCAEFPNAATHDAQGWHYSDEIQRQAGAQWMIHVKVMLPADVTKMKAWGGLTARGKTVAILNQPLEQNVVMGIDYT